VRQLSSVSKVWQPNCLGGTTQGISGEGGANWCYRRVITQSLMHAPVFFNFLGTHHAGQGQCTGPHECITCLYRSFSDLFWETDGFVAEGSTLLGRSWKRLNGRLNEVGPNTDPKFPTRTLAQELSKEPVDYERQEDTAEFFMFVLNALQQHGSVG